MSSLSDLIERYILNQLGDGDSIVISRGRIADDFECAPSQVTYVIATRFTIERGFVTESKRGGGGSITVRRVSCGGDYLDGLISEGIGSELTASRAAHICERMLSENIIDKKEYAIMSAVLSDRAMPSYLNIRDNIRAKIMIAAIEALLKE